MAVWLLLFVPKRARDQRLCWLLVVEAKRAPRGPAIGEKRDATVIGSRPAFVSQQELSGLDPAASGSRRESAASATGGSDPRCRRAWLRAVAEVRDRSPNIAIVRETELAAAVDAFASLIRDRFHDDDHHGVAAMLLDDGTILTGTAPDAINPSVAVCHEVEPYCAAFRLGKRVLASVCLHREPGGRTVVLSPCGVCR